MRKESASRSPDAAAIWLLWDGECDFCRGAAEWIEARNTKNTLTIIPYQQAPSPPMTPALRLQARQAVQVVTPDNRQFSGAAAILFALESVGWHAGVMRNLRRKPCLWAAQVGYRVVARYRGRMGQLGCCR